MVSYTLIGTSLLKGTLEIKPVATPAKPENYLHNTLETGMSRDQGEVEPIFSAIGTELNNKMWNFRIHVYPGDPISHSE